MKKIAEIVENIREEVNDAEKYAKKAVKLKDDDKQLAEVYISLAKAELEHMEKLHTAVVRIIQAYRSEKGAPPEYMMMVWNWEHERIVEKVAGVKMLIDMYNK